MISEGQRFLILVVKGGVRRRGRMIIGLRPQWQERPHDKSHDMCVLLICTYLPSKRYSRYKQRLTNREMHRSENRSTRNWKPARRIFLSRIQIKLKLNLNGTVSRCSIALVGGGFGCFYMVDD
ncbi:be941311-deec-4d3a-b537-d8176e716e2e [Sclerotinia trifoliorum]|uniref:Be941311-deec-4d3a-b537-d8176e716e2e n=1 Tax=Sclerotinia trifoliorum TaxID=28548 RepID=A0A8H2VWR2_9HELO|nr:be941311-deec-4d3a-b537-d8176e716e2e [Sclerotinia trifoliorum]